MPQAYGVRVHSIEAGITSLTAELEYLCSLAEEPDPEFPILDAVLYGEAVGVISDMLKFMSDTLEMNEQSSDGSFVKMTQEEVVVMGHLSDEVEDIKKDLVAICGISLVEN